MQGPRCHRRWWRSHCPCAAAPSCPWWWWWWGCSCSRSAARRCTVRSRWSRIQDPGSQVSQDQGRSRFLRGTSKGGWVVMRYLPLLPLAPRTTPSSTQPAWQRPTSCPSPTIISTLLCSPLAWLALKKDISNYSVSKCSNLFQRPPKSGRSFHHVLQISGTGQRRQTLGNASSLASPNA